MTKELDLLPNRKGEILYIYNDLGLVESLDNVVLYDNLFEYLKSEKLSYHDKVLGIDFISMDILEVYNEKVLLPYFSKLNINYGENNASYYKSKCSKYVLYQKLDYPAFCLVDKNVFQCQKLYLLGFQLKIKGYEWVGINKSGNLLLKRSKEIFNDLLKIVDHDFNGNYSHDLNEKLKNEKIFSKYSYEERVLFYWSCAYVFLENRMSVSCKMEFQEIYRIWIPIIIFNGKQLLLCKYIHYYLLVKIDTDKDYGFLDMLLEVIYEPEDYYHKQYWLDI